MTEVEESQTVRPASMRETEDLQASTHFDGRFSNHRLLFDSDTAKWRSLELQCYERIASQAKEADVLFFPGHSLIVPLKGDHLFARKGTTDVKNITLRPGLTLINYRAHNEVVHYESDKGFRFAVI